MFCGRAAPARSEQMAKSENQGGELVEVVLRFVFILNRLFSGCSQVVLDRVG